MNVKSVAGQLGKRRARFGSAVSRMSDFVALTKPRVMMLAIFTALVGSSIAPVRLDPLTAFAAVIAIAAGAGAAGALKLFLFSIAYLFVLFAALLIDREAVSFSSVPTPHHGRQDRWIPGSKLTELPPGAARGACCAVNFSEV
jgi:heme O synthase-like polyprenyltransferase